jgi:hypothetical protein
MPLPLPSPTTATSQQLHTQAPKPDILVQRSRTVDIHGRLVDFSLSCKLACQHFLQGCAAAPAVPLLPPTATFAMAGPKLAAKSGYLKGDTQQKQHITAVAGGETEMLSPCAAAKSPAVPVQHSVSLAVTGTAKRLPDNH